MEITAQSSVHPGNSDDIHCCLNDKNSLSEISRFPILNRDGCAVQHRNEILQLVCVPDLERSLCLDCAEKSHLEQTQKRKDQFGNGPNSAVNTRTAH